MIMLLLLYKSKFRWGCVTYSFSVISANKITNHNYQLDSFGYMMSHADSIGLTSTTVM